VRITWSAPSSLRTERASAGDLLGGGEQWPAVERRGDPLVGVEHDHAQPQAHARLAKGDTAALRQQQRHELALAVAQQQATVDIAAERRPGSRRGRDGRAGGDHNVDPCFLAAGSESSELLDVQRLQVVDRDQRHGAAGEGPDELAQLAVAAWQDEVGNAIAGS
jgi:hypothetical protein